MPRYRLLVCVRVRAGARNVEKARVYLQTAVDYGLISSEAARRLQVVELDLTQPGTIAPAIGTAAKVGAGLG